MKRTLAFAFALGLASAAQAQLLLGTANRSEPMYGVNLATIRLDSSFPVPANVADAQPLFSNFAVAGMAADDPNKTVFFLDFGTGGGLYSFTYDGLNPQFLGGTRLPGATSDLSFQGLAFDPGTRRLFAAYNVGGTPGEGIYELDWKNPVVIGGSSKILATPVLLYNTLPGGETAYDFRAIDFDPVTNRLYGINDDSDQLGRGLYAFDLDAGAVTRVVASPTYRRSEADFDGLATGGGKAYFTTDEPGFVYVYDLINGGPFSDFLSPVLQDSGLFAGAAYVPGLIPEPATLGLLALAGLSLARRR